MTSAERSRRHHQRRGRDKSQGEYGRRLPTPNAEPEDIELRTAERSGLQRVTTRFLELLAAEAQKRNG